MSQQVRGNEDARSGWHASEASAVARELGVEPEQGLTVEEARSRLGSHGPNRLTGAKKESGLQAFVFGTVELSFAQWSICIGIAASLLVVEELIKLALRRRDRRHLTHQTEPAPSRA